MHHAHLSKNCKYYFKNKENARWPLDKALTYEDVYQKFIHRNQEIERLHGYRVKVVWCCEIERARVENSEMDTFFKIYEKDEYNLEPIQARDGLYG